MLLTFKNFSIVGRIQLYRLYDILQDLASIILLFIHCSEKQLYIAGVYKTRRYLQLNSVKENARLTGFF